MLSIINSERCYLFIMRHPITLAKNILLVDDEPDVIYAIKNILEDNGFEVDSFYDPILVLNYYKVIFYV